MKANVETVTELEQQGGAVVTVSGKGDGGMNGALAAPRNKLELKMSRNPMTVKETLKGCSFYPPPGEKQLGGSKRSNPHLQCLLPDDLIYAILSRLQTKSVIRFTCVSKTWNSFIQHDPYFLQLRRQCVRNPPTDNLFLCVCARYYPSHQETDRWRPDVFLGHVPIQEDQGPLELNNSTYILSMPNLICCDLVVQSVNGLLCLYPTKLVNNSRVATPTTKICNPTTRQVVTLPHDSTMDSYPNFSLLTHFGYYPLGDKFKVLHVILNEANLFQELRILTVGDYVWRNVAHDDAIPYDLMSNNIEPLRDIGTCVNGAIHWLDSTRKVITVFDLGSEQFKEIPIIEFDDDLKLTRLIEFSGCLSLLKYDKKMNFIDLSILKDYENHVWIRERIILTKDIYRREGKQLPLCRVYTQEIMLMPSHVHCHLGYLTIRYYDTKRRSFRRILAVDVPTCFRGVLDLGGVELFPYHENFKRL